MRKPRLSGRRPIPPTLLRRFGLSSQWDYFGITLSIKCSSQVGRHTICGGDKRAVRYVSIPRSHPRHGMAKQPGNGQF